MAFTRWNTAEGGTNTTTVTGGIGGNSGAASGNYFETVSGSTTTFSNTVAQAGSLSYSFAWSATAGYVQWTYLGGTDCYLRFYVYFSSAINATLAVARFAAAATTKGALYVNNAGGGHWAVNNAGTFTNGTTTPVANTWYRCELWTHQDATAGQTTARIYDNTGVLLETITSGTAAVTGITLATFGGFTTTSPTQTMFMDNLAISDQGWIGTAASLPLYHANTAEGGTNTTTVTTANSGGGNGDSFEAVTIAASGTGTFSTAAAFAGSLGYALVTTTSGVTYLRWDVAPAGATVWASAYVQFTPVSQALIRFLNASGATVLSAVQISATPHWQVLANGATTVTGTTTPAVSTWYLIELTVFQHATAGWASLAVYNPSTGVLIERITTASNANTSGIVRVLHGITTAFANTTVYLDNLVLTDQWPPVPSAAAAATVTEVAAAAATTAKAVSAACTVTATAAATTSVSRPAAAAGHVTATAAATASVSRPAAAVVTVTATGAATASVSRPATAAGHVTAVAAAAAATTQVKAISAAGAVTVTTTAAAAIQHVKGISAVTEVMTTGTATVASFPATKGRSAAAVRQRTGAVAGVRQKATSVAGSGG